MALRSLTGLFVLFAALAFGRQPLQAAEPEKKPPQAEAKLGDLPEFPKDVRLGMDVKALLKLRPRIHAPGKQKIDEIDFSRDTHTLYEEIDEHRLTREYSYTIINGRCVAYAFSDTYKIVSPCPPLVRIAMERDKDEEGHVRDMETFSAKRASILASYHNVFGTGYKKWLFVLGMQLVSYQAPTFVWLTETENVALVVTGDYTGVNFEEVNIRAYVWDPRAINFGSCFEQKPKPELVETLFKPLEKAIEKKPAGDEEDKKER